MDRVPGGSTRVGSTWTSEIKGFFASLRISHKNGNPQVAATAGDTQSVVSRDSMKGRNMQHLPSSDRPKSKWLSRSMTGSRLAQQAPSGGGPKDAALTRSVNMSRSQPLPSTSSPGDDKTTGGILEQGAAQAPQKTITGGVHRLGANRGTKIEVLEAVGANPIRFDILEEFAQKGPRHRLLLASVLGSAMGGAEWTANAGNSQAELSANAITVFLRLSETSALSQSDCQEITARLTDGQLPNGKRVPATHAFSNPQSPFWLATQQLSQNQRMQLANSLSPLPLEVYDKSREYLQLRSELDSLERKLKKPFVGGPLENLHGACSKLGVDLLRNGGKIPDITGADVPVDVKARIERELAKPQVQTALAETQAFQAECGERLQELRWKAAALKEELQPYVDSGHRDLVSANAPIPESELTLRRNILVGKPGATFSDCWDAMVNGTNFVSYAQWESTVKEAGQQRQSLVGSMKEAIAEQPPDLNRFKNCARDTLSFIKSYREQLASFEYVYQSSTSHRIGDPPKDALPDPSLISGVVNNAFHSALQGAVLGALPEIKGKISLAGNDCGGTVKAFQKVLDHPEEYGLPADFQFSPELRELMATAQEIAKVMG